MPSAKRHVKAGRRWGCAGHGTCSVHVRFFSGAEADGRAEHPETRNATVKTIQRVRKGNAARLYAPYPKLTDVDPAGG